MEALNDNMLHLMQANKKSLNPEDAEALSGAVELLEKKLR